MLHVHHKLAGDSGHSHSGTQADMRALSWCYWSPRKGKVNSRGQQNAVPRSDT